MRNKWFYIPLILIALGAAGFWYYQIRMGPKPQQAPPTAQPPVVIVTLPKIQDVDDNYEFTGNTAALEQVEIKARVEGFLKSIEFADGAEVKKNQLLFTIEPDAFQARLDQAQAQLQAAQAEFIRAQLDYDRVEKAVQTNAVSQQELTTKKADRDKARASVMAARADLENAQLNLSYTRILSPIDGIVSRKFVDVGNLVGAGEQTHLATVVKTKPLYVYFNASEDYLQKFFLAHRPGPAAPDPLPFTVALSEEDDFSRRGILDYIDNQVDSATGTITIRGQLPNDNHSLLPGMFVRIRVPAGINKNAVLVEEKALGSDIGGKYLLVLDEQNVVHSQRVQPGKKAGVMRIITDGLRSDQRYIVSGFHFARPENPVTPKMQENQNQTPDTGSTAHP